MQTHRTVFGGVDELRDASDPKGVQPFHLFLDEFLAAACPISLWRPRYQLQFVPPSVDYLKKVELLSLRHHQLTLHFLQVDSVSLAHSLQSALADIDGLTERTNGRQQSRGPRVLRGVASDVREIGKREFWRDQIHIRRCSSDNCFLNSTDKLEAARVQDVHALGVNEKIEVGIELKNTVLN
jgi:hypothetical protein